MFISNILNFTKYYSILYTPFYSIFSFIPFYIPFYFYAQFYSNILYTLFYLFILHSTLIYIIILFSTLIHSTLLCSILLFSYSIISFSTVLFSCGVCVEHDSLFVFLDSVFLILWNDPLSLSFTWSRWTGALWFCSTDGYICDSSVLFTSCVCAPVCLCVTVIEVLVCVSFAVDPSCSINHRV